MRQRCSEVVGDQPLLLPFETVEVEEQSSEEKAYDHASADVRQHCGEDLRCDIRGRHTTSNVDEDRQEDHCHEEGEHHDSVHGPDHERGGELLSSQAMYHVRPEVDRVDEASS